MASATAQDFMKSISAKGKGTPSKNILYGVEGVGKTSLLANAAKPFCIMCAGETGLLTLLDNNLIPDVPHFDPFTSWPILMETLQAISEGQVKNIKTLFIDSAGTTQNLMVDHLIKTQCKGDTSRYSDYGHGVKISTPVWREFLALLDRINQTGIQVWLIGHSLVTTFKNPEGSDYNRYSLALQDAI
ncbi:MAG: AAA family ATPase, partial [Patescibacteria group bacterium]